MALGALGALVGGLVSTWLFGPGLMAGPGGTYGVVTTWRGWVMSALGGVVLRGVIEVAGRVRGDGA